ncbi:MAG TPA: hypothetical protein VEN81_04600, partial [Planctomycetota bacterium]|nr:hypothetical protein [Planctomycetota bacterium]
MSVLVLLLGAFLFLKWQRREAGPAVVKEPPPSPTQNVSTPPRIPGPEVPPTPPPPVKDPKEETYKQAVHGAESAIEGKRWDDAETAIKKARELFDRPELKTLLDQVTAGRDAEEAATKAELEARRKQEKAWVDARDRVEKDREKSFFDDAWTALETLAKDHPRILEDQRFLDLQNRVRVLRDEADLLYKKYMAEAQKALTEGRLAQAILSARLGGDIYPERRPIVKEFQDRV